MGSTSQQRQQTRTTRQRVQKRTAARASASTRARSALIVCRMRLWLPQNESAAPLAEPAGAVSVEEAIAQLRQAEPLTFAVQRPGPEIRVQPWWQATIERTIRQSTAPAGSLSGTPQNLLRLYEQPPALAQDALPFLEPLNSRETDILLLLAQGLSNQAMADTLMIAESTIKWHIKHLYRKLGVHSRTQALARARQLSLLPGI